MFLGLAGECAPWTSHGFPMAISRNCGQEFAVNENYISSLYVKDPTMPNSDRYMHVFEKCHLVEGFDCVVGQWLLSGCLKLPYE